MSMYPTALFLAVGDTLTPSGSDYVPSSGDYLNLLDPSGILCLEGGLVIPSAKTPADQKVAGATMRIRAVRSQPLKLITLQLLLRAGSTDSTHWTRLWAAIEHKLEQAAAASGPFGHGTQVCLLVRFATGASSSLGANFTAFDVVGGVCTPNDLLTNPGQAYGMTLELRCLQRGRLTAQTWPGLNTFTGTQSAGTGSCIYLGTGSSGPIGGHLGALAQIHILDQSTAGAINRVRIGRRNVPGVGGGLGASDWQPIVSVYSALGSASLVAGSGVGGAGANVASITVSDSNWHDAARILISLGTQPLYQAGIYDCYLRMRESVTCAAMPTDVVLSTTALSGQMLVPDTYSVVLVGQTTGPITNSAATTPQSITTTYPHTPNIFQDGFETGDAATFLQLGVDGNGTIDPTTGQLTVQTASAIAGTYGLHVQGYWNYSDELPYADPTHGSNVYTPFQYQVARAFSLPDSNDLHVACLLRLNGGFDAASAQICSLMSVESSMLAQYNQPVSWTGTAGSQTNSYNSAGIYGGTLAEIVCTTGKLELSVMAISTGFVATGGGGATPTLAELAGQVVFLEIILESPQSIHGGGSYTVQANLITGSGSYYSAISTTLSRGASVVPYVPDLACWGVRGYSLSGAVDLDLDDCLISTLSGTFGTVSLAPTTGIAVAYTNPNSVAAGVYLQQGTGPWLEFTGFALTNPQTISQPIGVYPATPPVQADNAPASVRPRIGLLGGANLTTYAPMDLALQNNQWQLVFLGTYALPPVPRFEGLNPAYGSGAGDFGFELQAQVQSNSGSASNTIQVDALYLVPHEEPQVVVSYPGLANTTTGEIVIDCRRDGRVGAILRSSSDFTTVIAQLEAIGHMELGPGNQTLVLLVERENGVHDVVHTQYGVCVRWQPLVDFVDNNPTAY